ncbi:hypothetical protein C8R48DRAFT_727329 [Suillus tomentosus]|nr:hypothetical protein C8R48DRAFT_727329 [Suillus tomentosus]
MDVVPSLMVCFMFVQNLVLGSQILEWRDQNRQGRVAVLYVPTATPHSVLNEPLYDRSKRDSTDAELKKKRGKNETYRSYGSRGQLAAQRSILYIERHQTESKRSSRSMHE